MDDVLRWFHLVAAMVWVGGLITLGALVPAMRRAGVNREQLQAVARQFGRVSWTAMLVAVTTGVWQVARLPFSLSEETGYAVRLGVKLLLVVTAISLAGWHQMTARRVTPAVRGLIQGAVLVVSLAIVGAAVSL